MLVISRRQGESVLIGDEIEIVITHVGRSRVRVGIRAPNTMPVVAREVKLVREQNLAAARAVQPSSSFPELLARVQSRSPAEP